MDKQAFIDQAITHLYQHGIRKGSVKAFCKRHNMALHQVRRRALALNVVQPLRKSPDWTEPELALLERYYHKTPQSLRQIFKRAGYSRSEVSIATKRKRLNLFVADADVYSSYRLAIAMGVDSKTVTRYITKGLLTATLRGTQRSDAQGGDVYQITARNVRTFIINNVATIDFRKIDKFWLVDMLTGSHHD